MKNAEAGEIFALREVKVKLVLLHMWISKTVCVHVKHFAFQAKWKWFLANITGNYRWKYS